MVSQAWPLPPRLGSEEQPWGPSWPLPSWRKLSASCLLHPTFSPAQTLASQPQAQHPQAHRATRCVCRHAPPASAQRGREGSPGGLVIRALHFH